MLRTLLPSLCLVFSAFGHAAEAFKVVCQIEGSAWTNIESGGTTLTRPHDHDVRNMTLHLRGANITKVANKDEIVRYANARSLDGIITATARKENLSGSVTLDLRSGKLHEVLFSEQIISNTFFVCDVSGVGV